MIRLIFLALCALAFAYNVYLNVLSRRSIGTPVPENLSDIYDAEKYAQWRSYKQENTRLGLVSTASGFVLIAVLLAANPFGLIPRLTSNEYLTTVFTCLIYLVLGRIVSTVIDYFGTFRIEEKYGFNKTTRKTFLLDTVKSAVIELVLIVGLTLLLELLYNAIGDYIILVFACIMLLVVLCITTLFPFFSKLFNKFTPLENKELEQRLTSMLEKNGIRVKSVSVMNASLRTTKSNAYFSGMGKTKSIVLYDNLVNNFTDDEILAVFAHEMGHARHKDIVRNYFLSFGSIVIMVLAIWALLKLDIYGGFGFSGINYGLALILAFECVIPLLSPLMNLVQARVQRSAEYRADHAAREEGLQDALISALKKLARENFVDLSPDPTLVALTYSHPTIAQRIEALEKD